MGMRTCEVGCKLQNTIYAFGCERLDIFDASFRYLGHLSAEMEGIRGFTIQVSSLLVF